MYALIITDRQCAIDENAVLGIFGVHGVVWIFGDVHRWLSWPGLVDLVVLPMVRVRTYG